MFQFFSKRWLPLTSASILVASFHLTASKAEAASFTIPNVDSTKPGTLFEANLFGLSGNTVTGFKLIPGTSNNTTFAQFDFNSTLTGTQLAFSAACPSGQICAKGSFIVTTGAASTSENPLVLGGLVGNAIRLTNFSFTNNSTSAITYTSSIGGPLRARATFIPQYKYQRYYLGFSGNASPTSTSTFRVQYRGVPTLTPTLTLDPASQFVAVQPNNPVPPKVVAPGTNGSFFPVNNFTPAANESKVSELKVSVDSLTLPAGAQLNLPNSAYFFVGQPSGQSVPEPSTLVGLIAVGGLISRLKQSGKTSRN
jgi:hypothetical protein